MTGKLQTLTVKGRGFERGLARGKAVGEAMSDIAGRWYSDFAGDPLSRPWDGDLDCCLDAFFSTTAFEPAIRQWSPDALEEVEGMARASGVPRHIMLAFQLWDELHVFRRMHARHDHDDAGGRCSALAILDSPDGVTRVAQNMDTPFPDGEQMLLRMVSDDGLETVLLTRAIELGLCGMNNAPLAVCCNTLADLNYAANGVPVAFILRRLLSETDFDAATDFLTTVPHAAGQNYTIGAPGKAISLECAAGGTASYAPAPGLRRLFHTNHALANPHNDMFAGLVAHLPEHQRCGSPTSHGRFRTLMRRLGNPGQPIDRTAIMETLRSQDDETPICRTRRPGGVDFAGFTFGSVICELDPEHPLMLVSAGPPSDNDYEEVRLSLHPR